MSSNKGEKRHVTVVVLGDFGRSPRMQYHTLSLAKHFSADVVAYKGADPLEQVTSNDNIKIHYLKNVPNLIGSFPKILQYLFKALWQSFFLVWTLLQITKIDCILLQNPPSIPTLPVCWFICMIRSCSLLVDFHNYGFTILELNTKKGSLLSKIAKWCEMYFSRKADKSICVTKAMKDDLSKNWGVRASVFYDCAPDIFHSVTTDEKHSFFLKMSQEHKAFRCKESLKSGEEKTLFTQKVGDKCEMLPERPAFVISSTSWTEDEDFSVLLSALDDYEQAARLEKNIPDLFVAITGKGPLKSFYEKKISEKKFSHVQIMTIWLKFEDYPTFLACADMGVSLHSSSSGFDLPMKVVDMFGCSLPVCAFSFHCIDELVKDGINGAIFTDSNQLSLQLQDLFSGFPKAQTALNVYHNNLEQTSNLRWEENWNLAVNPLLQELVFQKKIQWDWYSYLKKFLIILAFLNIYYFFYL